jgi:small subunit ribosomal protein S19e
MSFGLSISEKRASKIMARTIFTKDPVKFIPALAKALKDIKEFETPEWALYVKSGMSRERPPADEDFWYIRTASILRQLYIKGVVGVGKLRTKYGSKKDRGGKPDKFKKSGGKIIRVILQQAEAAGLVEKVTRLQHGRRLTQAGRDFLDSIEVEEKESLNFEEVSVKPSEVSQEIIETEIPEDAIEIIETEEELEEPKEKGDEQ